MKKKVSHEELAAMKAIMSAVDDFLNPQERRAVGFALIMWPYEEGPSELTVNYLSTCRRQDMIVALKSLIARWEGRLVESNTEQ